MSFVAECYCAGRELVSPSPSTYGIAASLSGRRSSTLHVSDSRGRVVLCHFEGPAERSVGLLRECWACGTSACSQPLSLHSSRGKARKHEGCSPTTRARGTCDRLERWRSQAGSPTPPSPTRAGSIHGSLRQKCKQPARDQDDKAQTPAESAHLEPDRAEGRPRAEGDQGAPGPVRLQPCLFGFQPRGPDVPLPECTRSPALRSPQATMCPGAPEAS